MNKKIFVSIVLLLSTFKPYFGQTNFYLHIEKRIETEQHLLRIKKTYDSLDNGLQEFYNINTTYLDDIELYNTAIFLLKKKEVTGYFYFINKISSYGLTDCCATLEKYQNNCLKNWLVDDLKDLNFKAKDSIINASMTIFNRKQSKIKPLYSLKSEKTYDSIRNQDQKHRWDLILKPKSSNYDSLLNLQKEIDVANEKFVDSLILEEGLPIFPKISGDIFFLMMMHNKGFQNKYFPFIIEIALNKKMSWESVASIVSRSFTAPNKSLMEFPFAYKHDNEIMVLNNSLSFLEKKANKNRKHLFYVGDRKTKRELSKKMESYKYFNTGTTKFIVNKRLGENIYYSSKWMNKK